MKNRIHQFLLLSALALVIYLCGSRPAHAQTYTWADNAQGQPYEVCPTGLGPSTNYYPSNSFWGQSVQTNGNCNSTGTVQSAPSNWDPAPPLEVYPGGPSAIGASVIIGGPAPTILNVGVSLNSLIIQTNGQLDLLDSTSIVANYYEFQGDGAMLDIGTSGGTPGIYITPGGTMLKSGGAGTYSVALEMIGTNNTFEVDSGTLAFPTGFGDANLDGGTFNVASNATLLLTVDSNATPQLNGTYDGVGGGTVAFNTGGIMSPQGSTWNFPSNMFQWTGGKFSGTVTNAGVLNLANNLTLSGVLYNNSNSLINFAGGSSLGLGGLYNEAGATFNMEGDSSIVNTEGTFFNYGLFWKSAGANASIITATFRNYGGTVEADTGTLALNVSTAGYFSNTTFIVGDGATIDFITNNYNMEIEGTLTGSGGGTVLMSAGTVSSSDTTTFNFPGAMFQWAGGKLGDDYANNVSNINTMTISGPVGINGSFGNDGTMIQSGAGSINSGNDFYNYTNALYDIQNDGGIAVGNLYNYGLLEKTGGTNISVISSYLYNYGPGAAVDVGAATLALTGVNNFFTNTLFSVDSNATLVFAPNNANYSQEMEGATVGSGGGSVVLSNGLIFSSYPATLNFPGAMLQWNGGKIGTGNNPSLLTNIGVINVSGPVALNHVLANSGTMIQSGAGSIGGGDDFYNGLGSVYNIQNDNGLSIGNIYNYGLLEKTGGTGNSVIYDNFYNYGPSGAMAVSSGTVSLTGVGIFFTNTPFAISPGAALVFDPGNANDQIEMEGASSAAGGGSMILSNGVLLSGYPATLNFPGSMFQWQGGKIGSGSNPSTLTNVGVINVLAPVAISGALANSGTMIQSGSGSIGGGSDLYNGTGSVYNIQNDNGLSVGNIYNYGLFEKTVGVNTSLITGNFFDWGSIQAPSGTLLFSNGTFTLNAGTFSVSSNVVCQSSIAENGGVITGTGSMGNPGDVSMTVNGGALAPGNPFGTLSWLGHYGFSMASAAAFDVVLGGSNQFSQFTSPNSSATVAGTLNVTLADGYAPPLGTQFQIVSTGSRGGTFSTLNVPRGIAVTYSNIGVFLTVTSALPAELNMPQILGTNFTFNFGTVSNQSYTIQQNTDLSTTNWTFYTNFIGNGSIFQFLSPVTNIPAIFFRVREP